MRGHKNYYNGNTYNGDILNYYPHGNGTMKYANGDSYEGSFNNGQCHGYGVKQFKSGKIYDGSWKYDLFDGYGVETSKGECYEGYYVRGIRNGKGKLSNEELVYEGHFLNGLFDGEGYITAPNGDVLTAIFREGEISGVAKSVTKAAYIYEGDFDITRKPHGRGVEICPNGDIFDGKYKFGQRVNGILSYYNGGYYEGEFKNGKMHGRGTKTTKDGFVFVGYYVNGSREGHFIISHHEKVIFECYFKNNTIVGELSSLDNLFGNECWSIIHENDDFYQGSFINGQLYPLAPRYGAQQPVAAYKMAVYHVQKPAVVYVYDPTTALTVKIELLTKYNSDYANTIDEKMKIIGDQANVVNQKEKHIVELQKLVGQLYKAQELKKTEIVTEKEKIIHLYSELEYVSNERDKFKKEIQGYMAQIYQLNILMEQLYAEKRKLEYLPADKTSQIAYLTTQIYELNVKLYYISYPMEIYISHSKEINKLYIEINKNMAETMRVYKELNALEKQNANVLAENIKLKDSTNWINNELVRAEKEIAKLYSENTYLKESIKGAVTDADTTCIRCHETFMTPDDLRIHMKHCKAPIPFTCQLCNITCNDVEQFTIHMGSHIDRSSATTGYFVLPTSCPKCKIVFPEPLQQLYEHEKFCLGVVPQNGMIK